MHCRSEMGSSLRFIKYPASLRAVIYCIEDTFNKQDTPISAILDFITIVHDYLCYVLQDMEKLASGKNKTEILQNVGTTD